MKAEKIELVVQRFNPERDEKPHLQSYKIEVKAEMTIIEMLDGFREKYDSGLAFRKGCRSGICGICALRINGQGFLGCKTKVKDVCFNKKIVIEPLTKDVIKDLVCNTTSFWRELERVKPWLIPKRYPEPLSAGELERIDDSSRCIHCGICHYDCGTVEHDSMFAGPAVAVKGYRLVYDSRDRRAKERLRQLNQTVWRCNHSWNCVEQCPKSIDITKCMDELKEDIIKIRLKGAGVRHVQYFEKAIIRYGKLNEFILPIKTLGAKAIFLLGDGMRLWLGNRLPPLAPKKILRLIEIKRLFKKLK